jgi:hypothetical protein
MSAGENHFTFFIVGQTKSISNISVHDRYLFIPPPAITDIYRDHADLSDRPEFNGTGTEGLKDLHDRFYSGS